MPKPPEITRLFAAARETSIKVLSEFDNSRWGEQAPIDCRFPTLGSVWENLATDSYWHLGEFSLLVPRLAGTMITLSKPRAYTISSIG